MKQLYLISILLLTAICTSCNSSPYRIGRVIGKHLRMNGRDTTYVVVFYCDEWTWEPEYSAVVAKEDYNGVNKGDCVEFNVEAGKK